MPNSWLPIFLDLSDKNVLLVGGGEVALEKLPKLYDAGAHITLVTKTISPAVLDYLATRKDRIELHRRAFLPEDAAGKFLIMSATGDRSTNNQVQHEAHSRHTLFNAADQAHYCDFFMTGTVKRGPLTIAISSEGRHPGLTRAVRQFLEEILPDSHSFSLEQLTEIRQSIRNQLPDPAMRLKALRDLANEMKQRYLSLTFGGKTYVRD